MPDKLADKSKTINSFEKTSTKSINNKLKAFAKNDDISLDTNLVKIKLREKKVVAKTFHGWGSGWGVVVPYNKKNQLGYGELSESYNKLKAILNNLDKMEC